MRRTRSNSTRIRLGLRLGRFSKVRLEKVTAEASCKAEDDRGEDVRVKTVFVQK